jgi:hypothetical protein
MHSQLTSQMSSHARSQQQRWEAWQKRQIACFNATAHRAKQDPSAQDAYTLKPEHPHLDRLSAWGRRLRG